MAKKVAKKPAKAKPKKSKSMSGAEVAARIRRLEKQAGLDKVPLA